MGNQPGQHFQPIYNPPVPFKSGLPMAPGHGASVIVNGMVPTWCNSFAINLETDNGDIAMHFNPRFQGTNQVIRNTCQSGTWGAEERGGYFPFGLGRPFELTILIEEYQYRISIDNQPLCNYSHRIPKDFVRVLSVKGEVQLSQVRFQGGVPPPIYNPPMPYNGHIPGGVQPGKLIRINGTPSYNPSRFNVNLLSGGGFNSNADIGLHCDFRFNYGDSRNVVIRTHRQHGGWGNEERHQSYFPFAPGVPFEIIIRVDPDKYCIAANGQHMFEFRHRIQPISRFDHLYIAGDVSVNQIQFQ